MTRAYAYANRAPETLFTQSRHHLSASSGQKPNEKRMKVTGLNKTGKYVTRVCSINHRPRRNPRVDASGQNGTTGLGRVFTRLTKSSQRHVAMRSSQNFRAVISCKFRYFTVHLTSVFFSVNENLKWTTGLKKLTACDACTLFVSRRLGNERLAQSEYPICTKQSMS